MTVLIFACLALATMRLSSLWFEEIARPVHEWANRMGGKIAFGANCPLCVSVWAAALSVALWIIPGGIFVLYVLAVSSAALVAERVLRTLGPSSIAAELARLTQTMQQVTIESDGPSVEKVKG
jgi:hypothetical protein